MQEMTMENSRRIGDAMRAMAAQMLIIADLCNPTPMDKPHKEVFKQGVEPQAKAEEPKPAAEQPKPAAPAKAEEPKAERAAVPSKEDLDALVARVRVVLQDTARCPKLRQLAATRKFIPVKAVEDWETFDEWAAALEEVGA